MEQFEEGRQGGDPLAAAERAAEAMSPVINLRDTGRFLQVLEALGCSLAVSRRPSGVAVIGVDAGVPTLSACLLPRSMGMAVSGNRLAVATMHELMVFANVSTLAPLYPGRPDHYDAMFVPRMAYYTGDLDLHDMAFDKHVVLAVNTRYSCISVIDGYFNFTSIWQPPFVTAMKPDDRCHLNGMAFSDGKVRFATALGVTDEPFGWRRGMADGGVVMEVPSGRIVASGLSMPHSPRVIGGRLHVLEGGRGQVLQIDPQSGARRVLATLPGFTHGLAEYGGVLFVGLSKLRDKRGPQGLPIESEADAIVAGVAALDANSGAVLGILQFFNGVDEIFDVQVLPNVRRAEILSAPQWAETPSIVTMQGGFWETRPREDDEPANVGGQAR
ncbi:MULTISPECIES: TIGR03032 family protein [unclassified Burkholderia]|uniref:TIGR03032 family protein n=1 Tax=unclassified Burkholderia TaxID=2613784 RepID=UPI001E508A80|nr:MULTISPECIES: TIGR03032 family protein [unclassified Burkholderia]UEP31346.1 TIGR03032 family protein [Burkholderia sp. B21-007]UEP43406.1 TIGR03032 family protein [Burkholderia sp. B21-005]